MTLADLGSPLDADNPSENSFIEDEGDPWLDADSIDHGFDDYTAEVLDLGPELEAEPNYYDFDDESNEPVQDVGPPLEAG